MHVFVVRKDNWTDRPIQHQVTCCGRSRAPGIEGRHPRRAGSDGISVDSTLHLMLLGVLHTCTRGGWCTWCVLEDNVCRVYTCSSTGPKVRQHPAV